MQIIGPAPLEQAHTCVSGRTCTIERLSGHSIHSGFSIAVMDTCGVVSSAHGLPGASQAQFAGLTLAADFGEVVAAGGTYRLCWCMSASCSPDAFRIDAGQLDLVGVLPEQHRTCIAGRNCAVDGILGHQLSGDDFLLILGTCGRADSLLPFSAQQVVLGGGSARATWSSVPLAAYGGEYRLCWCGTISGFGANESCTSPADFKTEVGQLTFMGPSITHLRTCISGQRCTIDGLEAQGANADSRILVAETCGSSALAPFSPVPRHVVLQESLLEVSWDLAAGQGMGSGWLFTFWHVETC